MKHTLSASRSTRGRTGQQGSAYMVTLLALVVLTIIGLSLVLITQTEMQLGANERITTRVFYAADAGVGIATARVLVNNDHTATDFVLRDNAGMGELSLGHRVELSPFHPILDAPCNLCSINQGQDYFEVNHAVTVRATRVGWTGAEPAADSPQLARKTVGVMIEIQPWQMTAEAMESLDLTPEQLAEIKF
jgi:Tfp pilus assembly protein PilX